MFVAFRLNPSQWGIFEGKLGAKETSSTFVVHSALVPGRFTQKHLAFGDLCALSRFLYGVSECQKKSSAHNRERGNSGKSLQNHLQILVRTELAILDKTFQREKAMDLDYGQISDLWQGMYLCLLFLFAWGTNFKFQQFKFYEFW